VAERPIRVFGDPVLKTPTDEIVVIDEKIHALVEDLLDTVKVPGRAGVAATQIGVGLRAFSYNVHGEIGYILNPRIIETRGELEEIEEGCLSVPDLWFSTPRYPYAKVEGIDLQGNTITVEGEGLMAQALQHECDHVNGLLYLDRLGTPTRKEAMKQVRESSWF
jgi:peptide deformylase